ncbi:MAG: hypothetical protein EOM23_01530 [Candidatus Moranbacteria bacterium]|nr:hypothetical protein [Candidatus Moranbacteria bacterium]
MLTIKIPKRRFWNSDIEEFVNTKEYTLSLEHSLVSVSKWEAKWHVPFISDDKKTQEQTLDYIKFMTLTQNIDDNVYTLLTKENFKEIDDYIANKMTATWFAEPIGPKPRPIRKKVITSELIYYWMISLEIPFECQKWHLNRLLTLIKVCHEKSKSANDKPKSKNKRDILSKNAELNAMRRKQMGTSG